MMTKSRLVFYFIHSLFVTFPCFSNGEERLFLETVSALDKYSYHSAVLDETITYNVALPPHFEQSHSMKFPIIYVLDGSIPYTNTANTAARNLWGLGPDIPPAIIIGLPSNNRTRDYIPVTTASTGDTGGADKYRKFLRSEFFHHIESHYRSNGHRILIGHSLGGLFALYDLINTDRLFQSYIAVDPAIQYGDHYLTHILTELPDDTLDFPGRLFIAVATKGTSPANKGLPEFLLNWEETQNNFHSLLQKKTSNRLLTEIKAFPTEDHLSVVTPSFYFGLRQAFSGYLPFQNSSPFESKLTWQVNTEIAKDPTLLIKHYQQFSKTIGVTYLPEQRLVEASGHTAMRLGLYDNAKLLFQFNTQNFPDNAYNWEALGEFYVQVGDTTNAKASYQAASKLDPDNQDYLEQIRQLSK